MVSRAVMAGLAICVVGMIEVHIRPIIDRMTVRALPRPVTRRSNMAAGAVIKSGVVEADAGPA